MGLGAARPGPFSALKCCTNYMQHGRNFCLINMTLIWHSLGQQFQEGRA